MEPLSTDPQLANPLYAAQIVDAAVGAVCEYLRDYEDSVIDDDLWENNPELSEAASDLARSVAKMICDSMAVNLESGERAMQVMSDG